MSSLSNPLEILGRFGKQGGFRSAIFYLKISMFTNAECYQAAKGYKENLDESIVDCHVRQMIQAGYLLGDTGIVTVINEENEYETEFRVPIVYGLTWSGVAYLNELEPQQSSAN